MESVPRDFYITDVGGSRGQVALPDFFTGYSFVV
jgi:hypothetical protein